MRKEITKMKELYVTPDVEIVEFTNEDIVTASGDDWMDEEGL